MYIFSATHSFVLRKRSNRSTASRCASQSSFFKMIRSMKGAKMSFSVSTFIVATAVVALRRVASATISFRRFAFLCLLERLRSSAMLLSAEQLVSLGQQREHSLIRLAC